MAKKVRFPLEMENGVQVRNIDELKENFSLSRVLMYMRNGRLITWLRDRYEDELADLIENLDPDDPKIAEKVSNVFDVPYDEKRKKTYGKLLNEKKEYQD